MKLTMQSGSYSSRFAFAAVGLSVFLSACIPLVPLLVGGAIIGGGLVATDRRTSGAQLEDEGIELRSNARVREAYADKVHVNIASYNRQVLLTGEVPTAQDKQQIEQIVAKVENVQLVEPRRRLGVGSGFRRSGRRHRQRSRQRGQRGQRGRFNRWRGLARRCWLV